MAPPPLEGRAFIYKEETMSQSQTTNNDHESVKPITPVAPYVGGKFKLYKTIVPLINAIPHKTYCEPFVGMGGIFLRRDKRPKGEVINDFNGELITLFRVIQNHLPAFNDYIKHQLTSRKEFERILKIDASTLTDIQRAAIYLYRLRTGFSGQIISRTFGVCAERPARFDTHKIYEMVGDLHDRLHDVTIENLNYDAFIQKYDRDATLFYLDPPYHNCEGYYGKDMFAESDFKVIAKLLKSIKGNFIMSINDTDFILKTFKDFNIYKVSTLYTVGVQSPKAVDELLVSNCQLNI